MDKRDPEEFVKILGAYAAFLAPTLGELAAKPTERASVMLSEAKHPGFERKWELFW